MAQIEYNDSISDLIGDMDSFISSIPEMGKKMLEAEADVVEPALKQSISSEGLVESGRLRDSIKRSKRKKGIQILLGPSGVHHKYVNKAGRASALRAGHLGYIFEHGAPRRNIRGRQWLSKAVQKSQAKALDAAENVRDQYLNNHNL